MTWAVLRDGVVTPLPPLERRTNGKESSSSVAAEKDWPTPAASIPQDGEGLATWLARREVLKAQKKNGNGCGTPLVMAALMEAEAEDARNSGTDAHSEAPQETMDEWPTPTRRDHRAGHPQEMGRRNPPLPAVVQMGYVPRPLSQEQRREEARGLKSGMWTTPQAHDSMPGIAKRAWRGNAIAGCKNLNDETVQENRAIAGSLHPNFVEALMMFPKDWTALPPESKPIKITPEKRTTRRPKAPSGLPDQDSLSTPGKVPA